MLDMTGVSYMIDAAILLIYAATTDGFAQAAELLFMPDFTRAESRFVAAMNDAEKATDADLKAHYFVDAHRRVTLPLYLARTYHPRTAGGRRAQRELVRYYELVDEELAIIRTKMSLDESYDYIDEWKEWNGEALRIRQRWADWVNGN